MWEEYRYDPLGRRIMKVTRYQFGTGFFLDSVDRTIWDGDQTLAEIRSGLPGNDSDIGETYGRVIYTHGPGIDAPLSLVRVGHPTGLAVILLRRNWRGFHAGGAFPDGSQVNSGGLSLSTLDWASKSAGAFLNRTAPWEETPWFGSLITEQRDGSGQIYRRNRYYDGATGQFTREDPIGFAGGLNLYGFGGGDPANYSDPYGLCPRTAGGNGITDRYDDCPKGTSGYFANREARGEGGFSNTARGVVAACTESRACRGAAIVGGIFTGGLLLRGAAGVLAAAFGEGAEAAEVTFQSAHAARHLLGTNLAAGEVEGAILKQVTSQVARASTTGSFWGRVVVQGVTVEYRAYTVAKNLINIGTYYIP